MNNSSSDIASIAFTNNRINYWNVLHSNFERWEGYRKYYANRLLELYKFAIPKNSKILEVGCGNGNLLAGLSPSNGVGIDFSSALLKDAKQLHPNLIFIEMDACDLRLNEKFDYIICSDILNELWDVQACLSNLRKCCHQDSRILINTHSNLWQIPRKIATVLGIARPQLSQNWLTPEDTANLLYLSDFEVVRRSSEILWPFHIPFVSNFLNKFLVKIFPFSFFGLTNFIIARPVIKKRDNEPIISVIIPARDEAGNIAAIFERTPQMGMGTELIFVEGGSSDGTYEAIEAAMSTQKTHEKVKLLRQAGKGKGDAVRLGFEHATGSLLMILDADLTVSPEDLPLFYNTWLDGKADFVNGVRMVYPMEGHAMPFVNMLGNKFFSLAFSYLLGQPVKDTACGTKVLAKKHWQPILENRENFGNFDKFGDWDLLFGASKFNLKIIDVPIRYRDRMYGETKMQKWRIGYLLSCMVIVGLKKLKFI
ncbi:glycosyltransferase [Polynucleobacter paneuropaeus]|nr:glycosyltransferase [Polynucleobacter paneuropaeus]